MSHRKSSKKKSVNKQRVNTPVHKQALPSDGMSVKILKFLFKQLAGVLIKVIFEDYIKALKSVLWSMIKDGFTWMFLS